MQSYLPFLSLTQYYPMSNMTHLDTQVDCGLGCAYLLDFPDKSQGKDMMSKQQMLSQKPTTPQLA